MGWRYRVVEHVDEGLRFFAIHETYHGEGGTVLGMAPRPLTEKFDSLDQLRESLLMEQQRYGAMLIAVGEPAITHRD